MCLVGSQLFWSRRREAYPEFVRTFGMPIYVNGQARGSLDPDDPHWFLQTRKDALKKADVVLIFGTPLDFRIGYGRELAHQPGRQAHPGRSRRQRARPQPRRATSASSATPAWSWSSSPHCARDAELDARRCRAHGWSELRALESEKWEKHAAAARLRRGAGAIRCASAPRSTSWSTPDTIVIGDGGDFVGSAANVLRPRGFGHWLDAGPLGTLGAGPGYAMAAKLA